MVTTRSGLKSYQRTT